MNDNHFTRLFKDYNKIDQEVNRIEQCVENTSDLYLDGRKKQMLRLKYELFVMLKKSKFPHSGS